MNQILMVEKAKREKGAPLDVETVVRIFAIAIMVFGIFMMASGVIALTTNQEEEEQNSNPVVTMEQQANKIIVNIDIRIIKILFFSDFVLLFSVSILYILLYFIILNPLIYFF